MANPSNDKHTPGYINPKSGRRNVSLPTEEQLVQGILKGDRVMLGKAITLVESSRPEDISLAGRLVEACLLKSGKSLRIGVTGSPGVGKSTFIEAIGLHAIDEGHKVAVLAIDPSSHQSKGSILGDKTRMEELGQAEKAFIRPSPAGSTLGGVARKTRESIILCEAAGFDIILVETVGVGQSEFAVHSMVDFFLLLILPGAGDELQGIKRGIVEMADLFAINKAEGPRIKEANQSAGHYKNALHLFPKKYAHWSAPVVTCSALERQGIDLIWKHLQNFWNTSMEAGFLSRHRKEQAGYWFKEALQEGLLEFFNQNSVVAGLREEVEGAVMDGTLSPFEGARKLLSLLTNRQ